MTLKVRLASTLVGKSNEWKRNMPKGTELEFKNTDTLAFVLDTVTNQFGNRALIIVNKSLLESDIEIYPKFYSAGWFISEEDNPKELVVVDHGSTMESATRTMLESVKIIDWNSLSVRV